jgi:hypothetical protein
LYSRSLNTSKLCSFWMRQMRSWSSARLTTILTTAW